MGCSSWRDCESCSTAVPAELTNSNTVAKQRYDALDRMATELNALNQKILSEKISREHNRAAGWGGTGLVSYG